MVYIYPDFFFLPFYVRLPAEYILTVSVYDCARSEGRYEETKRLWVLCITILI